LQFLILAHTVITLSSMLIVFIVVSLQSYLFATLVRVVYYLNINYHLVNQKFVIIQKIQLHFTETYHFNKTTTINNYGRV